MDIIADTIVSLGILINTIIALMTFIIAYRASHKIKELAIQTNSIKDELVKVTGESEFARGVLHGSAQKPISPKQ